VREEDVTLVLVEHDMEVVFGAADWITVMHCGRVLAHGPPGEISANPEVRQAYLGADPISASRRDGLAAWNARQVVEGLLERDHVCVLSRMSKRLPCGVPAPDRRRIPAMSVGQLLSRSTAVARTQPLVVAPQRSLCRLAGESGSKRSSRRTGCAFHDHDPPSPPSRESIRLSDCRADSGAAPLWPESASSCGSKPMVEDNRKPLARAVSRRRRVARSR
jgi:hypothetical protein